MSRLEKAHCGACRKADALLHCQRTWLSSTVFLFLCACTAPAQPESSPAPARVATQPTRLRVDVVASYPHDSTSYTQGLVWTPGDVMYESSGGFRESRVTRWSLTRSDESLTSAGRTKVVRIADELFAEGLTIVDDRLLQLTWKSGLALVYEIPQMVEVERVRYQGEGWGLAFDGKSLIQSDGSHILTFRDPRTLVVEHRLEVRRGRSPQDRLNELEWVNGSLYANVYQTDEIVQIDPATGAVLTVIDASGLLNPQEARNAEVLNGIAYRASQETFLLTGKYWPRVFEVRFIETVAPPSM